MNILKKIFFLSFKFPIDLSHFIMGIIFYAVAIIVSGQIASIVTTTMLLIPLVGKILAWFFGIISGVVILYSIVGLVLLFLVYYKVIKD